MAKVLKTVAVVAGAVALVATGLGAFGVPAIAGISTSTIAGVATAISGVASLGSSLLTKPPPARGSVSTTIVEIEPPSPYLMGEGYFGGVMRHRTAYGPTLDDVPNPYLFEALVYSHAGPVDSLVEAQFDFKTPTNWYSGYYGTDSQVGATPESDALVPPFDPNAPGWSTSHKLSGQAAIGWGFKFDKDGKRFANGLPVRGAIWKGVKVYDPRKDSTFPGGSGAHRINDETTFEYSDNPALHAGTYAYGRYQNGKRVMGIGLPEETIDFAAIASWANDCDANGWNMFGVCFEPGDRWRNLKDICAAGGGQPLFANAVLSFHWSRPRVSLDTVTEDDLADVSQEVTAMQSWRDRLNTIVPKYLSQDHNWDLVSAEKVVSSTAVSEDGEERVEEWPFNFVKDKDQAAQLAAYRIVDSRELMPITLVCKPRLRSYQPGECLTLDLPQLGLSTDAVILKRNIDPATMTVTFTLMGETASKHAFALGKTGVAPPSATLTQSAQDRDETSAAVFDNAVEVSLVDSAAPQPVEFLVGDPAIDSPSLSLDFTAKFVTGQIWYDTANGNAPYRWNGSDWILVQDDAINTALADALAAQTTADSKTVTFRQSSTPTSEGIGDQWFKTDTEKWYIAASVGADEITAGEWELAEDSAIGVAILNAATAQATADGKVSTYIDENEPFPIDLQVGDPSFDSPSLTLDFTTAFVDGDVWFTPTSKLVSRWNQNTAQWDQSLADITKSISGASSLVLDYDSGGTLTTTTPLVSTYKIAPAGGTALTSGVTWSVSTKLASGQSESDVWSGTVPSISGSGAGQLSINSGLKISTATLEITATIANVTYPAFTVRVNKVVAAPQPEPADNTFDSASLGGQTVSGTTFGQIASLTVTTGGSSTDVDLTANSITIIPPSNEVITGTNIQFKWQYESSPSTWTDIGTADDSSPDPFTWQEEPGIYDPVNGSITSNENQGSLSSSTSYNFRLMARCSSGDTSKTFSLSGMVSAQG